MVLGSYEYYSLPRLEYAIVVSRLEITYHAVPCPPVVLVSRRSITAMAPMPISEIIYEGRDLRCIRQPEGARIYKWGFTGWDVLRALRGFVHRGTSSIWLEYQLSISNVSAMARCERLMQIRRVRGTYKVRAVDILDPVENTGCRLQVFSPVCHSFHGRDGVQIRHRHGFCRTCAEKTSFLTGNDRP